MTRETGRSTAAETGQLQTLHRALDLLEALAAGGESTVGGLSESLGLARSTTHRLLATLTTRGYVRQDAVTGRYRVGVRSFEVGSVFLSQNPIKEMARPVLRELNQQFNESLSLAILDGDEAVYVDVIESNQTLRTFARIGARVPLHSTGVGKALLVGFNAAEIGRLARRRPFESYTPHTMTSPEQIVAELRRADELGYVLDREEHFNGVHCAAAPVKDHTGQVVAAISISGPAYRIVDNFWVTMARAVAAAASELSRSMGHAVRPARG